MAVPTVDWASIPASELTDRSADLPLMGTQIIPVSPTQAKWVDDTQVVGGGDITSWTDRGTTAAPTRWTYDGYGHRASSVGGAADNVWHLCFDFGTAGVTFDYFSIINHNYDANTLISVELQVADDNNFTTNLRTIGDVSLRGDEKRMIDLVLDHVGGNTFRYTDVRYCKLKLTNDVPFVPTLGEIFIGRTYQLSHKPAIPWDPTSLQENVESDSSESGVIDHTVHYRRRFDLSARLDEHESDHIADLKNFYRETRGPFVWVYEPNSAPNAWHFMMRRSALNMPAQGFIERETSIEASEQGPQNLYLDVEDN